MARKKQTKVVVVLNCRSICKLKSLFLRTRKSKSRLLALEHTSTNLIMKEVPRQSPRRRSTEVGSQCWWPITICRPTKHSSWPLKNSSTCSSSSRSSNSKDSLFTSKISSSCTHLSSLSSISSNRTLLLAGSPQGRRMDLQAAWCTSADPRKLLGMTSCNSSSSTLDMDSSSSTKCTTISNSSTTCSNKTGTINSTTGTKEEEESMSKTKKNSLLMETLTKPNSQKRGLFQTTNSSRCLTSRCEIVHS